MTSIHINNNIHIDDIELVNTIRYDKHHYVWPITYKKKNVCLQSSYLQLIKHNKQYNNVSLSTYHKPAQVSKQRFIKLIRDIDKKMIQELRTLKKKIKYKQKILYKKSYVSQNKYIYYNFPLQHYNKKVVCNIYDEHKGLQTLNYIEKGCDVYSIVWLKNMWLKDNKAGLNYIIIQLKVYKPIVSITKCIIIEDDDIFTDSTNTANTANTASITTKSNKHNKVITDIPELSIDPIYTIYFKMKKMGVPVKAIQMKMTLAGHDPDILTSTTHTMTKKNKTISTKSMTPMDLLAGIKHKKLKKTKKKKVSEKDKKKRLLQRLGALSRQNGIPTLEEILQTRNRLKKIK